MLTLEHDRICFHGRTVADIRRDLPLATLRHMEDEFVAALDEQERRWQEDEHAKACKEQYEEGFEAGKEEGADAAKEELAKREAEIDEAGFERGYNAALADVRRSADVDRVQAVLEALREIHNALLPVHLGFEEEGKFRRRPAKLSEAKKLASSACAAARRALLAFETEKA